MGLLCDGVQGMKESTSFARTINENNKRKMLDAKYRAKVKPSMDGRIRTKVQQAQHSKHMSPNT